MEAELGQALELAQKDYSEFSQELLDLENQVGSDLPILLSMTMTVILKTIFKSL